MSISDILFNDFKTEYQDLEQEIDPAIKRVLQSGIFLLGVETEAFETELAKAVGQKYAVAVANGTEALAMALIASGIKPGDEVIVPALTAYPTVIALEMAGAIPVVCEVDADTGLLDPAFLPSLLTKKTAAIVPVHLYGQICPMKQIAAFAKEHKLKIIEDCAQAIFAKQNGKMAGSWSVASALSFYPSKNLGAYGDAGAVVTNNPEIFARLKRLRQYGQSTRYVHDEFGFNSRINELQASILRVKLPHTAEWIERRQKIADHYLKNLLVGKPLKRNRGNFHTYHLFVLRSDRREAFMAYCQQHKIPVIVHYPRTVYQQPAFRYTNFSNCPNAETLAEQIVSLPIHPYLPASHLEQICDTVNKFQG